MFTDQTRPIKILSETPEGRSRTWETPPSFSSEQSAGGPVWLIQQGKYVSSIWGGCRDSHAQKITVELQEKNFNN